MDCVALYGVPGLAQEAFGQLPLGGIQLGLARSRGCVELAGIGPKQAKQVAEVVYRPHSDSDRVHFFKQWCPFQCMGTTHWVGP